MKQQRQDRGSERDRQRVIDEVSSPTSDNSDRGKRSSVPSGPRLSWRKKLIFAVLTIVIVLCVIEGGLWLFGVRPVIATEDPYVGFSSLSPLFEETKNADGQIEMQTADSKKNLFNFQRFPRSKPSNSYRIFCLGGSTTLGRPYDDLTSFCGWLREFLPRADRSRQWEVINCGGESYASYREALIVEEACRYKPDLFIVYGSHNEFLERRTYHTAIDTPPVIRGLGTLASRTHLYAAARWAVQATQKPADDAERDTLESEVRTRLDRSVGPTDFSRDDELRKQIVEHYRYNLARIVDTARANGADVLFIAPAANLRDFSPFKSEYSPDVAKDDAKIADYQRAYSQAEKSLDAANQLADVIEKFNERQEAAKKASGKAAADGTKPVENKEAKQGEKQLAEAKPAEKQPATPATADAKKNEQPAKAAKDLTDAEVAALGEHAVFDELNRGLAAINRAVAIDNRFAAGHYLRGKILYQLREFEEAKKAFERAIDEDVCPLRAVSELPAAMREVAEEREVAVIDFSQIMADMSPHGITDSDQWFLDHVHPAPGGHELLAQAIVNHLIETKVVAKTGDWNNEAIAEVEKKILGNIDAKRHATALRNLAKVLEWGGKFDESSRMAERASQLDPTDAESFFRLAAAAEAQEKYQEAVKYYELCLQVAPKSAAAVTYIAVGGLYERNGQFDLALQYYRLAQKYATEEKQPRFIVQSLTLIGGVLAKLDEFGEAEEMLLAAIRTDAGYAEAHNRLALLYARQNKFEAALEKVAQARRLEPNNPSFLRNEGGFLISMQQFEKAKERLLVAASIRPDDAETHAVLADVYLQLGDSDNAEKSLRTALRFNGQLDAVRANLGRLLAERGEYEEAEKLLSATNGPESMTATAHLAWRSATHPDEKQRSGARAVAQAERVRKQAGDKWARGLDILAAAYAEAGRFDDAVATANLAIAAAVDAKDQKFADAVKVRLEGYRQQQPFRDTALAQPTAKQPAKQPSTK